MQRTKRWLAAVVACALAGCVPMRRAVFADPVVTVRRVSLAGFGLSGGTVDVEVSVFNPNRYALRASHLRYVVSVDSMPIGRGAIDSVITAAAHDSTVVHLPVRFTLSGAGAAGISMLTAGRIPYRLQGEFTVETPLGTMTKPFDRAGQYAPQSGANR